MKFNTGQDYNNVYFMDVDAQNHSTIVASNDADKVDQAFDEFERVVYQAVDDVVNETRCRIAESWGWAGDGGLFIFYDENESTARTTCMRIAELVLQEMPHLNQVTTRRHINGEIRVRISVHKGQFRYKGDERRGSVHSKQLNFCVHLQKKLPSDTIGIAEEIYSILEAGERQKFAEAIGNFERQRIYIKSNRPAAEIQDEWRTNVLTSTTHSVQVHSDVPVQDIGLTGVYSQRAMTNVFLERLAGAQRRVWTMGLGLGGFQIDHKAQLAGLSRVGRDIRLLALDPDRGFATVRIRNMELSLPAWRDMEGTTGSYNVRNIRNLYELVQQLNAGLEAVPDSRNIALRYYRAVPSFALLIVDDVLFVSPYVVDRPNLKLITFECLAGGRMFDQFENHFSKIWASDELSRVATPAP